MPGTVLQFLPNYQMISNFFFNFKIQKFCDITYEPLLFKSLPLVAKMLKYN